MNGWLIGAAALAVSAGSATPPPVERQVRVAAPPAAVWDAWTTATGLTAFFAPAANLELRVGGAFEILFYPDREPGQRGAEGTRLMALEPPQRLAFSWDAPPQWPAQRAQRTMVEVRLAPAGDGTLVELIHHGFGDGPEWQQVRDYFADAWVTVLGRLKYRFEVGPIDWDHPPRISASADGDDQAG